MNTLYEIRTYLDKPDALNTMYYQDKNYLMAIGSEHCCVHFLRNTTPGMMPKKFTLVTPKTDTIHFNAVVNRIIKLCDDCEVDSIVINDWGILQYLYESGISIQLTIGRVLLGSFGYKESMEGFIHKEEREGVVKNFLAPSVIHKSKIELFKKYRVTAVEVCLCENEENYMNQLKKYGMQIHLHVGTYLAALSKTCYKTIRKNAEDVSCNYGCNVADMLKLEYIDGYNPLAHNSTYEDDYEKIISSFRNYYLVGNAVYRKSEKKSSLSSCYDRLIVDSRFL